jgi:hypothetical protein
MGGLLDYGANHRELPNVIEFWHPVTTHVVNFMLRLFLPSWMDTQTQNDITAAAVVPPPASNNVSKTYAASSIDEPYSSWFSRNFLLKDSGGLPLSISFSTSKSNV